MFMICLGIESTAHTFGVGIINSEGVVLANEKSQFVSEEKGMKPFDVAEHHVQNFDIILKKALDSANIELKDVDLISFSQGPGIGHMLRVGAFVARLLALRNKIPLIGVNHCIAHLSIGEMLTGANDSVLLYASGANTQIIAYEAGKYRIFGETLDIGVGNLLDVFARHIGEGFPGGPKIEKLALSGKNLIEVPYTVKGMDVSFGGILTNLKQKFNSLEYTKEDLCLTLQEYVFAMLIEVSERAMAHTGKSELLLGGGVACNKRLKEMSKIMCLERGAKCFVPENQFLVDNAAMIAWQGIIEYNAGSRLEISNSGILPYSRTDDVFVNWK